MIVLKGKIIFDPVDRTAKHKSQASWKKVAIITFEDELNPSENGICDYYAWFINKRYSIKLNKPLRGAHITIINDSLRDIGNDIKKWDNLKRKYNNTEIEVSISVDPRTDSNNDNSTGHWWLPVPEETVKQLQDIRSEIGLRKPFYSFHMSIGLANEKNIEQSKYIHRLITKYGYT